MKTNAESFFNCRKRRLSSDGHSHGAQRKRRVLAVPDCFVPPPEANSADFDMRNFILGLPKRWRWRNGLDLLKRWFRASQDAPHAQGLRSLTSVDDVELGRGPVVVRVKVENSRKVALEAARPPPIPFWKNAYEETTHNDTRLGEMAAEVVLLEERLKEQRKPAHLDNDENQSPLEEPPKEDLSQLFVPLTTQDENEVHDCLYGNGSSSKVLVLHKSSNIEVSMEKIRCLRPHGWLNDEVINLYLELLKERRIREPKRFLKCHFFNTFFYKKLACGKNGYDYKSVKRWTTARKLGYELIDCEKVKWMSHSLVFCCYHTCSSTCLFLMFNLCSEVTLQIFVPVHQNVHWCLAIINMKAKTLQYLDSLGGKDPCVPKMLARYIVDEVKDKSNKEIDISSWTEEILDYIPLQENGWDCGMFMLKYIDFHSRGVSLSFGQEHMEYFRRRTAKEILRLRAD